MTTWGMYWFTRLDNLQGLGVAGAIACGVGLFGLVLVSTIEGTDHANKWGFKLGSFFLCFSFYRYLPPLRKKLRRFG